jgi:hypothetical protein
MQPSPIADTSKLLFPSLRFCIASPSSLSKMFTSVELGEDLIERVLLAVIRTLDGYDPPPSAFQSRDLEMDDEVRNFRAVDTNARSNHINSAADLQLREWLLQSSAN